MHFSEVTLKLDACFEILQQSIESLGWIVHSSKLPEYSTQDPDFVTHVARSKTSVVRQRSISNIVPISLRLGSVEGGARTTSAKWKTTN